MFIAALFTIVKAWKQHKCPSADERIKMWCIYSMEYYLTTKKNEVISFAATGMGLEIITLSEMSDTETQISCDIAYISNLKTGYK